MLPKRGKKRTLGALCQKKKIARRFFTRTKIILLRIFSRNTYLYKTLNNTLHPKGEGVNSLTDSYVWEHALLKET